MAGKKFHIIAKNPGFNGQRIVKDADQASRVNVGSLTVTFKNGKSVTPVSQKHAEAFCTHFPQYEMVAATGKDAAEPEPAAVPDDVEVPVKFLKDHKIGTAEFKKGTTARYKYGYAQKLADKGVVELIGDDEA